MSVRWRCGCGELLEAGVFGDHAPSLFQQVVLLSLKTWGPRWVGWWGRPWILQTPLIFCSKHFHPGLVAMVTASFPCTFILRLWRIAKEMTVPMAMPCVPQQLRCIYADLSSEPAHQGRQTWDCRAGARALKIAVWKLQLGLELGKAHCQGLSRLTQRLKQLEPPRGAQVL